MTEAGTPRDRALGGYRPEAGRNSHVADEPVRIPVPSLLRSLLTDHLDPGYAAAAERRQASGDSARRTRSRLADGAWLLVGVAAVSVVFGTAAQHAVSMAPATTQTQHVLSANARTAEGRTRDSTATRDALAGQVEAARRSRLAGDAQGRELLAALEQAEFGAGVTAVTGPGLTVTVTEPPPSPNLSDVSKQRVAGSPQTILDRDLQLTVNSLWAAGAEAVSVGGVRIGPNVTMRQAGGGILVDNQPVASPYVVVAIGPPHAMQEVFEHTPAMQRLTLLAASYGVGISVQTRDRLTVSAASVRDVNFARQSGPK
ncbi:DUF881 domain-containing protein [Mycolicibacterium llatzerense]|uniref:Membrane associated protein n=1 Tax=Mycolicibacterium llatzerense TaxID=280871 RepID=A0A0D1J5G4_9MYCO|nr:DUF881 domain-containing protein [Mycolicibacterium llatzerense]KIU16848.1 hypothetical protein TL10_11080 [Mycolicibacterium llatzerense]MCT7370649.1 hypothetical protein [Mycolicibacterium llatzerense]